MKPCFFIAILLLTGFCGTAQISLYEGTAIANPQTFADQAFKFVANGDNFMQQGHFEKSIMAYDNAIAQNPDLAEAFAKRAIAKYRIGRESEAKEDMKMANAINPYAGDLHGFGGTFRRLHILAFEPIEWIAQPNLNYMLNYYKELWDTKEISLEGIEITEKNVDEISEDVLIVQIIEWIENDELNKAKTVLLSKKIPKAIHYDFLGIIKKVELEWESAYNYFEKAIELSPTNASSYYFMSIIKTHDEKYEEAISLIDKALSYDPKMLKAYFHKAVLHKMLEAPKAALDMYELLEDKDQLAYEMHVNLAITKKLMGDPNGAMEHIDEAIDLQNKDDENPALYKLRGNIYVLINDYPRAIEDYNKAIELDNNFAEAYFNRGMAQILHSNRADACYDLQKSMELGYLKATEKMKYFCVF